jgi:poly-gamma-glutamate capsule biosynthesis protein CapA/YwtB (metallophosphatase superfamily)
MLGRSVADEIDRTGRAPFDDDVVAVADEADLFVLNLECCVSARGERWPAPSKPFFFRAPPAAAELLAGIGVDCVTLANNHALDYGQDALLDTLEHLRAAGVESVGAGEDVETARAARTLSARGRRLTVVAASDHPRDFAAGPDRPGIAFADLQHDPRGGWLADAVTAAGENADAVLVACHWGPNMTARPAPYIRTAAQELTEAGATLVAGHSAHVFHGVADRILYDLGDFVDDYRVDQRLRNDLGLLFLVELDEAGPRTLEAVPLKLDFCHTRLAGGDDAKWIARRFTRACAELGTVVTEHQGRLQAALPRHGPAATRHAPGRTDRGGP